MRCPFCSASDTCVLESRTVEGGEAIRRRRECEKCGKRFTTFEKVKGIFLWVIKKDGRREPFDKEKIRRGILRAIHKRPVSLSQVDGMVDDIEREILRSEEAEVATKTIGNAILKRLKKVDKVAWLRFASVYLEFKKVNDFEDLVKKLRK